MQSGSVVLELELWFSSRLTGLDGCGEGHRVEREFRLVNGVETAAWTGRERRLEPWQIVIFLLKTCLVAAIPS